MGGWGKDANMRGRPEDTCGRWEVRKGKVGRKESNA